MIVKNKPFNDFDMFCDFCSYSENFDTDDDWQQMIQEAKDAGWKIFKSDDEWRHKCPTCVEEKNNNV
jgi:hypothetical protein